MMGNSVADPDLQAVMVAVCVLHYQLAFQLLLLQLLT